MIVQARRKRDRHEILLEKAQEKRAKALLPAKKKIDDDVSPLAATGNQQVFAQ